MDLKTHTAYPEIQISEVFNWSAKIIGEPAESFEDFVASGGAPEDFVAPVRDSTLGEADSREEAVADAAAWVESVADEYLRPVEEEIAE